MSEPARPDPAGPEQHLPRQRAPSLGEVQTEPPDRLPEPGALEQLRPSAKPARARRVRRVATRPAHKKLGNRLLFGGVLVSALVFFATFFYKAEPDHQVETPLPSTAPVRLGPSRPSAARLGVNDYVQVQLPVAPDEKFGTVLSPPSINDPVVEVVSPPTVPPVLHGLRPGTVLLTVLQEPRCAQLPGCQDFRHDLGAVQLTVTG